MQNLTILPNPINPDSRKLMSTNGSGSANMHKPTNLRRAMRVHGVIVPSGYFRNPFTAEI